MPSLRALLVALHRCLPHERSRAWWLDSTGACTAQATNRGGVSPESPSITRPVSRQCSTDQACMVPMAQYADVIMSGMKAHCENSSGRIRSVVRYRGNRPARYTAHAQQREATTVSFDDRRPDDSSLTALVVVLSPLTSFHRGQQSRIGDAPCGLLSPMVLGQRQQRQASERAHQQQLQRCF